MLKSRFIIPESNFRFLDLTHAVAIIFKSKFRHAVHTTKKLLYQTICTFEVYCMFTRNNLKQISWKTKKISSSLFFEFEVFNPCK